MATSRSPKKLSEEVAAVAATAPPATRANNPDLTPHSLESLREDRDQARRVEAMTLRLAGFTYEDIGRRMTITAGTARALVARSMQRAENESVEEMRQVENARLDRAQAAIWTKVIAGDEKAIASFLAISARRAALNGMDAPKQIQLSVSVRQQMEEALGELEVVLGMIDAEVVEDDE